MANDENLIPMSERTKDEQREIATKGGKASGEARRKKRDAKSAARMILDLPTTETVTGNLKFLGVAEDDYTNMVAIMGRAFLKAMTGDVTAMNFLIEMAGYSPKFKLEEQRFKNELKTKTNDSNAIGEWIRAAMNADSPEEKDKNDG